ncbi:MAG: cation-translocating P-type ATPase [archaeon]|nr:cation-translocating P-type ATPase [archaeon]
MNKIKKAISGQATTFTMIVIGALSLLMSFLHPDRSASALLFAFTMALTFLAASGLARVRCEGLSEHFDQVLLVIGMAVMNLLTFASLISPRDLSVILWVPVLVCGVPIVIGAVCGLVLERDVTADVLVAVAMVASVCIGELCAAAEIAIIMQIGAFLEEATVADANRQISEMFSVGTRSVTVVRDGRTMIINSLHLKVGDTVRVGPGEMFSCDGTVLAGSSSVDTSTLTGESVPRDVSAGDRVFAGTVNMYGSIDVRADAVGDESSLARMSRLLEEADAGRSRIVRTADRWARWIVALALCISVATYLFTSDVIRAVTVLVVFCPCALLLATPTAIMAAAGNLGRHGILVRDGGALERLATVDTFLMDKTGTLTTGSVECFCVVSVLEGMDDGRLASLMSAVEQRSEHPLGRAIAAFGGSDAEVSDFEYVPGRGVSGTVDGLRIFVGNRLFISEHCPVGSDRILEDIERAESEGRMVVLAGVGDRVAGYALLSDPVRGTSRYAVRHLWMLGMRRIMITGDSRAVASRMREDLRMDDVVWECLPSDKLRIVSDIDSGGRACMIGDGVNDAPALRCASVGIAMGGLGSPMAMGSSDIVFMDDDLSRLPGLIRLARRTMTTIRAGIAFSLLVNVSAMVLAVLGLIDPVVGALVHNIGSVVVITAAAVLLRHDAWRTGRHRSSVSAEVAGQ